VASLANDTGSAGPGFRFGPISDKHPSVTERPLGPATGISLPDGVDEKAYTRIRALMRVSVLKVWSSDHVVAGMDPWAVVDEAWISMAESGFRSAGPFLPFALRVARNKAIDAITRAEARRRDRSLDAPIGSGDEGTDLSLSDVVAGSAGAEADYFNEIENAETVQLVKLAEEAIYQVLNESERTVFLAVQMQGKSRAAVGRDLDPPVTGQRVGQIVAAATTKIRAYVNEHSEKEWM
jgi:DNA-directed RNA polymerase specialized sigma24 family protein